MKKELLAYSGVALLALSVAALVTPSEVFTAGRLVDTDAYMRLVRVRLLLDSGGWFDASLPRSNWPFGEVSHWTRPMDLLLLAGALPLRLFTDAASALHLSGIFVPTVLFLGTLAAVAWAADATSGERRLFAMALVLVQPAVVAYAQPGRPDHHALILLLFAVALGFLLRGLDDPGSRRWRTGLGVTAGLGLWVSTEFLLPVGLFLAGGMAAWIRRGDELTGFNLAWTRVFAATVAGCFLVERGMEFLPVEYDKISLAHLAVALLAVGVWTALGRVHRARGLPSPGVRAAAGAALGGLSLAVMAAALPRFFGGPMVDVTDRAVLTWLHRVQELQPLVSTDGRGAARLFLYAGTALVAMPYLAVSLRRRAGEGWEKRFLLLAGIAGILGLSLLQFRWITYVEIMAAVAVADFLSRSGSALRRELGPGPAALLARVSWCAAIIGGPVVVGALATSAAVRSPGVASPDPGPRCEPEAIVDFLATDPRWSREPRTVAAHPDVGPALLYRSRHRVLATPYHRNEGGIRATRDLFAWADPSAAPQIVEARRIDLVLICPDRDSALYAETVDGATTLHGTLLAGEPPPWLEEVALPASAGSARLYQVSPSRLSDADRR